MTICCLPLWLADGFCAIEEGDFNSPLRSPRNDSEAKHLCVICRYAIPGAPQNDSGLSDV